MRLALIFLLASVAFAQPPVVRGTASSVIVIGAEGILAEESMPGRWLVRLDTAATQKLIAQEVAAALKTAPIGAPLKGSGSLDFPAIADGTCSKDLNFPLAGAVDAIAPIWPEMEPGVLGMMRVIAAGLVAVRMCNLSGAAIDPPARTYGAVVR